MFQCFLEIPATGNALFALAVYARLVKMITVVTVSENIHSSTSEIDQQSDF